MGDPETKAKRSFSRKRDFIAKKMFEEKRPKIHMSEKDREKQRKWRLKSDPEGDYENLDDFIMREDRDA